MTITIACKKLKEHINHALQIITSKHITRRHTMKRRHDMHTDTEHQTQIRQHTDTSTWKILEKTNYSKNIIVTRLSSF